MIEVEFWERGVLPADNADSSTLPSPTRVDEMLVYIDFECSSGEGNGPQSEYVHRMNEGIRDALKEGVPKNHIDTVVRKYIPSEEEASDEGGSWRGCKLSPSMTKVGCLRGLISAWRWRLWKHSILAYSIRMNEHLKNGAALDKPKLVSSIHGMPRNTEVCSRTRTRLWKLWPPG
ncbi:hypothetical protein B0T25DRAFT_9160 [Lasiosphaeria hispida]|uniref:Uncharacterized protein n=1 Tax=Lasiosphaeria hispida TaxID=260671 RepID=A0AAJ0MJA4_9PEZI|nr:hypothetical protein B0T25DRAFT_9160 [Lasiosphaeria hispida]